MRRRQTEPPEIIFDAAALSTRRPLAGLSKAIALTSLAAFILLSLA